MQVAHRLYVSDEINTWKKNRTVRLLKKGKEVKGYFAIYYNEDSLNPLEIIESEELNKDYYKDQKLTLVGLALEQDEAFLLVESIIHDMVIDRSGFLNRDFFK